MVYYPKFLSNKPRFFGLGVMDVAIFAGVVNILNFIGLEFVLCLIIAIFLSAFKLILEKWVDLTGLFVSYPKIQTLDWRDQVDNSKGDL